MATLYKASVQSKLHYSLQPTGMEGILFLATIFAAPVVLGLTMGALACGLLDVTDKYIGRRLVVQTENTRYQKFLQRLTQSQMTCPVH